MSKLIKETIKHGIYSGFFYASAMALFDYLGHQDFNLWKFIFGFLFFGFFSGLLFRPTLRKNINSAHKKDRLK